MVAVIRHTIISLTAPLLSIRRTSALGITSSLFLRARTSTATITSTCRHMSWLHNASGDDGSSLEVVQFPCLNDNYGYLIHDPKTLATAAIDTPDASAYQAELSKRGWTLTHIFNTHHHYDHVGGNAELKKGNVQVFGPKNEEIPGKDVGLGEGDSVQFGSINANVIDVGGHTLGHIAYNFPAQKTAFVGDSLFALGCGRMFEGTPQQFWASLQKLRNLPDDTKIYCAHEYTESNAAYALSVEPGNVDLVKRVEEVKAKRARGEPTVPSFLGEEKLTNPFLRGDISQEIRKNVAALNTDSDADVFRKIRLEKDNFRG